MDSVEQNRLSRSLDEINQTMIDKAIISEHEERRTQSEPWLFDALVLP
jgi:hypothetical protein